MTERETEEERPQSESPRAVGFWEAFRYWLRLGFVSFGGPAGQIAIMQRDLVDRRRWISADRFLHALSYCLHAPARAGSAAARDLHRLAPARNVGRGHGRRVFRPPIGLHPLGALRD